MRRRKQRRSDVPQRPKVSHSDYKAAALALAALRNKEKSIKAEQEKMKDRIKSFIREMPKNSDGSFTDVFKLPESDYELVYSPRKQVTFVDNAIDLIDEWGLYDDLVREVPVIDKSFVEQAVMNGTITDQQLADLTTETVTYQLSVKPKKA